MTRSLKSYLIPYEEHHFKHIIHIIQLVLEIVSSKFHTFKSTMFELVYFQITTQTRKANIIIYKMFNLSFSAQYGMMLFLIQKSNLIFHSLCCHLQGFKQFTQSCQG